MENLFMRRCAKQTNRLTLEQSIECSKGIECSSRSAS